MSFRQKVTTGFFWNFTEELLRRGITTITTLVLAYFLTPEDFGQLAIMMVFLVLGNLLVDSGLKQALIRSKTVSQKEYDTAFYANLILSLLVYGLLFYSAPQIASFYQKTQLTELLRVAGLSIIINAFQMVQAAALSREMKFDVLLKVNIPAGLLSGMVAIVMAWSGWGIWSLVTQVLVSSTAVFILLWSRALWRPGMSFSYEALQALFSFSSKLLLTGILDVVFKNLYIIFIAKLFGAGIAGFYFFSEKIRDILHRQLVYSLQVVSFPALAKIQDDNVRLKEACRKLVRVMSFVLLPGMLFIAALAQPLFEALLPEKWWPAVMYLQFLALASLLNPLHMVNFNVLNVKGRSDLSLYITILKKALLTIVLLLSLKFGVVGILVGQLIFSIIVYLPNSYYSIRMIDYSIREQLADYLPSMILASSVAGMIFCMQLWIDWPAIYEVLILSLIAAIVYLAGAHLMRLHAYYLAKEILLQRFHAKPALNS